MALTRRSAALLDPLKTTVVQDQRSMTTWVVRKDYEAASTRRAAADSTRPVRPMNSVSI